MPDPDRVTIDRTTPSPALPNLLGLPRRRLAEALAPHVDRPYRVEQVYRALYEHRAEGFDTMTDLGRALRRELARHFAIRRPEIAARHVSGDGTVKVLFRLDDGATVEAVDIPDGRRRTLCVSSQAGCALGCRFCVTGFWGAGRDLTAGEIVGQVQVADSRVVDSRVVDGQTAESWPAGDADGLNLVFMGMGEPLLNLGNLADALEILFERISWRRVTVSTAGVIPGIEAMARWPRRPQLAISLHAPDDERRSALMPINDRYPLDALLAALERWPLAPRQRLTFEYILIRDFNDAPADADALARRLARLRAKVNLIPLNEDPVLGELCAPAPERVELFRRRLAGHGLRTTVRRRRGEDVSAACGQLRAFGRSPRGFRHSRFSF
jgi:23S rRNA (adenine2503-C2)-methyltransferase